MECLGKETSHCVDAQLFFRLFSSVFGKSRDSEFAEETGERLKRKR